MAILKNGINGPFSGKIGTAVGTSWRGLNIIRSRPKPPTDFSDDQLANQMRMIVVQDFLKQFVVPIRIGFRNDAIVPSAYNSALSYHKKFALAGKYPAISVNLPAVKIASGDLWMPEDITMQNDSIHIEVSWTNTTEGNAQRDDQLLLVLWDERKQAMQYSLQAYRSTGHFVWEPGFGLPGAHVWAAFIRQDRTMQSESKYLGVLV